MTDIFHNAEGYNDPTAAAAFSGAAQAERRHRQHLLELGLEYLSRPRRLENAIRRKEAQLQELRACLLPGVIRYDADRVQQTPEDKLAEIMARVDELEREIRQHREDKAAAIVGIGRSIEQLDNDLERTVLAAYYIERRPIHSIAEELRYSSSRTYALRQCGVQHLGAVLKKEGLK